MGFAKGHKLAGSRKGVPNKVTTEVRELARGLFDKQYWASRKKAIAEGTCPPQIEGKLLAYAYGEPKQEHNINHGIQVTIGYLPTAHEPVTIEATPITDTTPQIDSHLSLPAARESEAG